MKKSRPLNGSIAACRFPCCDDIWRRFLAVSTASNAYLIKFIQEHGQHVELLVLSSISGNHLDEDLDGEARNKNCGTSILLSRYRRERNSTPRRSQ